MKQLFHGTNTASANRMFGPPTDVDVSLGRGELGRGFYMGEEPCLAAAWARSRHGKNPSVLEFTFDNAELVKLKTEVLGRRKLVLQKWRQMLDARQTTTFLFNTDLIMAPFALLDLSHQYKFESLKAQSVVNAAIVRKIL